MYNIEIADPFLKRQLLNSGLNNQNETDSSVFSFYDEEEFVDHIMSYMMSFTLDHTFDLLLTEELCEEKERGPLYSLLSQTKIENIMDDLYFKIKSNLEKQFPLNRFDFISFFLSEMNEERRKLKNMFYETLHSLYASPAHLNENLLPDSTEELVYFIVLQNGGVELKDKFSDEIDYFPYSNQEEAVAKTCHLNPESLIIYDELQLLDPEMVICLKQLFGKKVSFIDSPFPEY